MMVRANNFAGGKLALIASIDALLNLEDAGALAPHPLGGAGSHTYRILADARQCLSSTTQEVSGVSEDTLKRMKALVARVAVYPRNLADETAEALAIMRDFDPVLAIVDALMTLDTDVRDKIAKAYEAGRSSPAHTRSER